MPDKVLIIDFNIKSPTSNCISLAKRFHGAETFPICTIQFTPIKNSTWENEWCESTFLNLSVIEFNFYLPIFVKIHCMIFKINPNFKSSEKEILNAFVEFDENGVNYIIGQRNKIKLFDIDQKTINVKSFKIPNKLNQIVYKFFRPSKAKRSYEFALKLLEKGIGTPTPVAYYEDFGALGLQKSYYASIHQDVDLTFRELVEIPDYPDHENILRQFSRFCYRLHQAGVEFKDHSPGNTLIKKQENGQYSFYLVDLNRMKFHNEMSLELRMKNLSRLTPKKDMIKIMADEYAKISQENAQQLFEMLWRFTTAFQHKFHRKQKIKKRLKSFLT